MTSEKKVLRVTKLMSCMHQGKIKAVLIVLRQEMVRDQLFKGWKKKKKKLLFS